MAAQPVTLYEHQYIPYDEIAGFPGDLQARERMLAGFERLNRLSGQEILHLERKGLRAAAHIGVIRAGELTIEILPKLDAPSSSGRPARLAVQNLLAMLAYAYDLRIHEQQVAGLASGRSGWFDLLIHLFAAGLYQQVRGRAATQLCLC